MLGTPHSVDYAAAVIPPKAGGLVTFAIDGGAKLFALYLSDQL